jgi:hypothetical protein
MAMIGGACRFFVVIVVVIGVRMEMPAADDRQQLRLVAACRRFDMLMMPTAADERVHEQRGGGEVGDESTHAEVANGASIKREAYRIHRTNAGPR